MWGGLLVKAAVGFPPGTVARNKIAQQFDLVVRTTPQLIVEIAMHKHNMHGKYTPDNLAKYYNSKVASTTTTDSDEITGSFVDQAITIWNRLLSIPDNMDVVMANVNTYGHATIFSGVGSLQALVSKGQQQPNIKWFVNDLDDQFRNGNISSRGLGVREMQGAKKTVSWPEKSLFRMAVLKHLRDTWMEIQPCSAELKSKLRECTESHKKWRELLGYQNEVTGRSRTTNSQIERGI